MTSLSQAELAEDAIQDIFRSSLSGNLTQGVKPAFEFQCHNFHGSTFLELESRRLEKSVRLAQGKNLDRVQRLLLVTERRADAFDKELLATWPGLVIAQPVGEGAAQFLEQFRLRADEPPAAKERIYLVDPYGNLMMSYESNAEPGGMLKDLEHLLKWSSGE